MNVSFKEFASFLDVPAERLDEIWSKIMAKRTQDAEKKKEQADSYLARVKKQHAKYNKPAGQKPDDDEDDDDDDLTPAEKRKKELEKKREETWAKTKDRMERGSNRPAAGRGEHRSQEVAWHRAFNEGQEHFTRKEDWDKAVQAAGFKIKKLTDRKFGAFRDDEKVGELKDLGSRFDGWLLTD